MQGLLAANGPGIDFIYGLSIFLMGWTVWMQPHGASGLRLARSLPYLAAYGILRGLSEWGLVFIQLQQDQLDIATVFLLRRVVEVLTATSFLGLFLFGCDLLRGLNRRLRLLPYTALVLYVAWVVGFLERSRAPLSADQAAALISASQVWARYLLVVPGTLLSAVGLHLQTEQFRDEGFQPMVIDLRVASVGMAVYFVLAGILVPKADFFPANLIHVGLFPQMDPLVVFLRRLSSIVIAFFLIRTLRVFDTEIRRRLEQAEAARAAAEERERLGLELHDGILQSVYATGLGLQAVRKRIITDPAGAAQRVDLTLERLNHVIDEIRAYIASLTSAPVTLQDLRLALERAVKEFETLYGVPVTLTMDLPVDLSRAKRSLQQIMPILQETISNTGRHANATAVAVSVQAVEGVLRLTVTDNGRGFHPETALGLQGHYGLQNLYRRAESTGGSLRIDSAPGKGTRVEANLPLQKGEVPA